MERKVSYSMTLHIQPGHEKKKWKLHLDFTHLWKEKVGYSRSFHIPPGLRKKYAKYIRTLHILPGLGKKKSQLQQDFTHPTRTWTEICKLH
jgi:hypothetical protein